MFTARNIRYELADRVRGLGPGGIGAIHLLARKTGLVKAIDRRLHLLKLHLPYHESDHVLNIAYNIVDFRPFVNGGRVVSPGSGVFSVFRPTRPAQSKWADWQNARSLKVLRRRKMARAICSFV